MNRGFWDELPRPFFVLAPMYDVTDVAFRRVVARVGRPHVLYTEFVSTDGLCSPQGRERLMYHLKKDADEHPIVAQIFGAKPDKFTETAKLIRELGFSGVDINMGCPKKAEMRGGACAALFKTPELAQEIIEATREGSGGLPVSVKIRIGDTKIDWENWIAALLKARPATISIHLRTRKEMSKVPAHWELMPNIVKFIHEQTSPADRPLIVGNGDVLTRGEAKEKAAATGCDGVMIGRGIFQNPWVFAEDEPTEHLLSEKIQFLIQHAEQFEKEFTGHRPFELLKRFYKIYISGFDGAAELREKLYTAASAGELRDILAHYQ
jgi:tRNA-dihydrouridine synthase